MFFGRMRTDDINDARKAPLQIRLMVNEARTAKGGPYELISGQHNCALRIKKADDLTSSAFYQPAIAIFAVSTA